jgi:Protein of unknown function (DUF3606)
MNLFGRKGPNDSNEINPKLASDVNVTGQQLYEAIRVHGKHVAKVRRSNGPPCANERAGEILCANYC